MERNREPIREFPSIYLSASEIWGKTFNGCEYCNAKLILCWFPYTLENTEGAIKMDNQEKLATYDTQDEDKQSENTTQYALDTTMCKQTQITQIRHEPSYKQLEVKTNWTSFLCGNRNGHHNTEFRS
jgi:hypothetical protein